MDPSEDSNKTPATIEPQQRPDKESEVVDSIAKTEGQQRQPVKKEPVLTIGVILGLIILAAVVIGVAYLQRQTFETRQAPPSDKGADKTSPSPTAPPSDQPVGPEQKEPQTTLESVEFLEQETLNIEGLEEDLGLGELESLEADINSLDDFLK